MPKKDATKESQGVTPTPLSGKGSRVSATPRHRGPKSSTQATTRRPRSTDDTADPDDRGMSSSQSSETKPNDSATGSTYGELLASLPEADERPARYIDPGGTIVYRASSFGGCERALVAASQPVYSAMPHQEWFQKVLDEGRICEPLIDAAWVASGDRPPTVNAQEEFDLELIDDDDMHVVLRVHIDGMAGALTKGGMVLREFKKVRPGGWEHFKQTGVEHLPQYPWQCAAAMLATGYEMEFVGGKLDIDQWGNPMIKETHCHYLTNPPIPYVAFVKRARKLEKMIALGFDAREVDCINAYPCPYFKLHDIPDEKSEFALPELGLEAGLARQAVATLLETGTAIKELEKQKRVAVEQLKGCLEAWGEDALNADVLDVDGHKLVHVRQTVEEHVVKEHTREWFQAQREKK